MKNRKWQRILSWILTLTMLLGTFESNILAVNAMDDEAIEADAEIDEEDVVEADEDVEEPEIDGATAVADASGVTITGSGAVQDDTAGTSYKFDVNYGKSMDTVATFKATKAGDTVTWKLFEKDAWKEAALPAGLTGVANNDTYTISGTPTEVGTKEYKLSAVSSNGTASANAIVKITVVSVNAAGIEMSDTAASWSNIKMGYTVDASAAASSSNVVPKTITLTNSTGVDLTGLTVKLDGANKDSFELTGAGTDVSIAKNGTISLTVAPKSGLVVKNKAKDETDTFAASISISANYLNGVYAAPINVSLTLKHNIDVNVTKGGAAYTKADLGTVSAGDAMQEVVYTATGSEGLTWNEKSLLDAANKSLLPEGVTGTINGATLTIKGTPAIKDANLGEYTFSPSVNDANGNYVVLDSTNTQKLSVSYANVAYTVDGEKLGDAVNKAVNSGYLQTDGQLVIVAANNSASEVTVKASVGNTDFSIYGNAEQKIAAGATAQFVVNPNTGWTEDKSVVVTLSGNGLKTTTTTYKLIVSNGLVITNPVSDNSVINATVGTAITDFKFAAKGVNNGGTMTWSVSADKPFAGADTVVYGDTYKPVSANELKTVYGLEVKNGVLTGTAASANNIAFTVSVNQGTSTSSNVVLVKIASSNTAIAILDADGNELKVGKDGANGTALTLPVVGTNLNDVKGVSANVTIKNNSTVNIGDVTVELDGAIEKYNTTSKKFEAVTGVLSSAYYEIVGSPVSVTASSSKTFTIQPKVAVIEGLSYAEAGSYRMKVKVNTNKNVEAKYFYALVEVKAAPEIYGYTTKTKTTPVKTDFVIDAKVNADIVSVNMVAVSDNAADAKYPLKNVEWSWTAVANSSIPEGLALSADGKITGTPTKAGLYSVSFNVLNKDTGISTTRVYIIDVAATGTIDLKDNDGNAITAISFNGAVKGAAAGNAKNVFVWAGSTDVKNIEISVKDASASYNGSAAHFTVDTASIATLEKNTNKMIKVAPADTTAAGTYHAIVTVSSNEAVAKTIDVWFVVVDALTVSPAEGTFQAEVGQPFSLSINAAAVEYKDKNGVTVSENKSMTWAEVSANGVAVTTSALNGTDLAVSTGTGAKGFKYAEITQAAGKAAPGKSGTYTVSVNGKINAVTGDLNVPSQSANAVLTIEIAKSASVNVSGVTSDAGDYPKGKATSANNAVTAYEFASRAAGYASVGATETATFTVSNNSKIALTVSANSSDKNFVVDGTLKNSTSIAANGNNTFTVAPKAGLAAGTYTADIVISGAEIVSYTVPVTFTVEAAAPAISVSANDKAVPETGLVLDPQMKGSATTETTTVSINNTGNVSINIVEIREVKDAEGTNYAVGETGQKLAIVKNAAEGKGVVPGKFVSFTVAPSSLATAGVFDSYVKIVYKGVGGSNESKVVKVSYVVYKNEVSANVAPAKTEGAADNTISLNSVSVNEGYSETDATGYTKNITVTVGEAGATGDATDSLYGLTVSISDPDKFVLGSADAKVSANKAVATLDVLAKGSSCGFTVAPKVGLPYGKYSTTLTISAKNLKGGNITKTITFSVEGEKLTAYTIKANSKGTEETFAVNAQRIFNTLSAVSANDAKSVSYDTAARTFYINADKDSASKNDISVSFNDTYTTATVKKLSDNTVTKDVVSVNRSGKSAPAGNMQGTISFNTIYFELENIVTFDPNGGKFEDGVSTNKTFQVPNGKAFSSVSANMPNATKASASLESWMDLKDIKKYNTSTPITKDITLTASWADHKYHATVSGDVAGEVEWTWVGTAEDSFKGTYVTLWCVDANCPDKAASKVSFNAVITAKGADASCTTGASKIFTATVVFGDATYTDTKTVSGGEGLGHEWKFDTSSVVWAKDYSSATISKNCVAKYHDVTRDGDKKVAVTTTNISFNGVSANCTTSGNGTYTATFTSADDPAISENIVVSVSLDMIEAFGHKWGEPKVNWTATFNDTAETAKAEFVFTCERDAAHVETLSADKIEVVSSNDTEKEFKATVSFNEKTYTDTYKALNHTEHVWDVKFTWVSVSTNKADTVVTAEATCKNGGEKVELPVTLEDKTVGSKIQYTAIATDGNGKVWKETKNIDTKNGDIKDGPAGTPTVEGGDIVIIGVEETYAFTGSKIKPAITVMDGDIVLAETTDYTYKVTGKNKIGEINKVEVTGKGNYAGKSATAQFTIVDPRTEVEAEELADNVKKVTVSEKKFTYDGTAKYPATVTVDLKDKTQIVYTYDGDGEYSTDSEKKVGLSFSNNVKKGTATVAAYGGKDKSPKKATYKIEAADIASAEFEISAVDWAVKAATPDITATIQLGDETVELVAGQDYKVSFTAKAAGKGTAKISGKGNFKGKHADVAYDVNALEITENNIIVKALAGKKVKDVKVTVVDGLGNTINKKFYTVEVQDAEGNALDKKAALPEEIKVVVKAANASITTADDGVSVDVKTGKDISKVKGAFKVDKAFYKTYTGEPITLDADDFGPAKIVVGELELDTDFAIVGYKNNIKKGTMTVTVEGRGDYSGTKTFKVKIKAKPLDQAVKED